MYNKTIAINSTDVIVNSVIVLFIMDLDEWIFAALKAWNEKWTAHASDSESSSDSEAEKAGAIEEMKGEIALQKSQIADQQEELMLQRDQVTKQNNEIAMLRETLQKLLGSHITASTSPESIPQYDAAKKCLAAAKLDDYCSDAVAGEKEAINQMEDENSSQKGPQSQPEEIALSHYLEHKEEEPESEMDSDSAYSF